MLLSCTKRPSSKTSGWLRSSLYPKPQVLLLFYRETPLIHLNYAVFLYKQDKKSAAAQQLKLFNAALRNHKPANPDPEVILSMVSSEAVMTVLFLRCMNWETTLLPSCNWGRSLQSTSPSPPLPPLPLRASRCRRVRVVKA